MNKLSPESDVSTTVEDVADMRDGGSDVSEETGWMGREDGYGGWLIPDD